MAMAEADRPAAAHASAHGDDSRIIQWNESAAIAARRLRQGMASSLTVMADGRPIGRIRLADIERCEKNGNWLDAVLVHHLARRPDDTCN